MKTIVRLWGMAAVAAMFMLWGCTPDSKQPAGSPASGSSNAQQTTPARPVVNVPVFSSDSAYAYIQKQVDFGPRVPGTPQHKACAQWLEATLKRFAPATSTQSATVTAHDGKKLPVYNIIAAFNPQATRRILLCAHWDSRPNADQDTERTNEPILGANDGASGVGILLEIARQLAASPTPSLGVDIILFDTEDYGDYGIDDSFCLGSQYWSKNLHSPGYRAEYGILLDMVGAPDALFLQEQNSLGYAPDVVKKVWNLGTELGYGSYFINKPTRTPITDDHLYINQNAKIPTIDIIHYTYEGQFGNTWHTHKDNMNAISKTTLQAVGHTLITLLYREQANAI